MAGLCAAQITINIRIYAKNKITHFERHVVPLHVCTAAHRNCCGEVAKGETMDGDECYLRHV